MLDVSNGLVKHFHSVGNRVLYSYKSDYGLFLKIFDDLEECNVFVDISELGIFAYLSAHRALYFKLLAFFKILSSSVKEVQADIMAAV